MNLKRKIEILGLEIPIFLLVAALVAAPASAALLNYYGEISGMSSIEQAVLVNGNTWDASQFDVDFGTKSAGSYFTANLNPNSDYNSMDLETNDGERTVNLQVDYNGPESTWSNTVEGVTAHNVRYEVPEYNPDSDIVVDQTDYDGDNEYETIQAAVDAAGSQTVYVEAGTYGHFNPGEDTTVVSVKGPGETEINLNGESIEPSNSADLTIKGFSITGSEPSEDPDGAIFHTGMDSVQGSVTVEDCVFDGEFDLRAIWIQEADATIKGNFFTGVSDAGIEFNAQSSSGKAQLIVEENTFAGLADKGVALRAEADRTDSIEIKNNNFVSNSNAAIQTGWSGADGSYTHAEFTAENNYFDHTGTLVEDNTDTEGVDKSLLSTANKPQTDGEVIIPSTSKTKVYQLVYLDVALGAGDYGIRTQIEPVR